MTDQQQAIDLLNATHQFPTHIMVKVVGKNVAGFAERIHMVVLQATSSEDKETLPMRTRHTPGGRHISLTFEPLLENAEQVLALYARLRDEDDVVLLL